jgi:hypothetical protein
MLSPTEIIHHTGLVTGVNLLTVNLHDVRARLEQQPAIKGATVQRDFDGRLTVSVLQRQPIAWVKCEAQHFIPRSVGQGLLVDADGIAFPADTILPEFQSLPVIADESCQTEADVERCAGHFTGINIKLCKAGGLTPARRMIQRARELGLKVMVGCMCESSIGISATAQLLPLLDYADLDGALLLGEDVAEGVRIERGRVSFPNRPGTGVVLL